MRICVCSDIHGNVRAVKEMLAIVQADVVLFLGDGLNEFSTAAKDINQPCYAVSGNCDIGSTEPESRFLELGGKRIFMTHGNKYQVKLTSLPLKYKASAIGADIVLYGHTHNKLVNTQGEILFLNPGSLGYSGDFGLININDDGKITFEHKTLKGDELN